MTERQEQSGRYTNANAEARIHWFYCVDNRGFVTALTGPRLVVQAL